MATSIFPTAAAGGLAVRNAAGGALNPPGVENAYNPKPAYIMDCTYYALPSDCTARIEPRQINAIVSELVALAECFDPSGPWDCNLLTNLCRSFSVFRASFTPASLISADPDNTIVLGSDNKLFSTGFVGEPPRGNGVSITTTSPFAVIPLGTVNLIVANATARTALVNGTISTTAGNILVPGSGDQKYYVPAPPVKSVNGMVGDVIIPGGGTGGGDVFGPASAVAGNLAIFYNITGKVIADSGVAISSLDPSNRVMRSGDTMTGALRIAYTSPSLILDKPAGNQAATIVGRMNGFNRWYIQPGDSANESGDDNGSDFRISRFGDDGLLIDSPFTIRRVNGHVVYSSNVTAGGTIWSNNGGLGALNGNSLALAGAGTAIYLAKDAISGQNNLIRGLKGTDARWQVNLGDSTTEAGANSGSDFRISSFSDSGTQRTDLLINRSSGNAQYSGTIYIGGTIENSFAPGVINLKGPGSALITLQKASSGQTAYIRGMMGALLRWQLQLGDTTAEGGGDVGSNFLLSAYHNDGTFAGSAMTIRRNDLAMTVVGEAFKPGGGPWSAVSDERVKTVLGSYVGGLAEIQGLEPVRYSFKGNETDAAPQSSESAPYPSSPHYAAANEQREFIGLVAQPTERVMPELVKKVLGFIDGVEVNDLRQIDTTPLIFALVNAVKELAARVEQLEQRP